ncbi:MAG: Abi family protein [Clostridiales bacterium]|nr:Abi family protein [Clostridiales bacterium]
MDTRDGSEALKENIEVSVKQPKNYDEQVALIVKKGFIVDDKDSCAMFLHKANYYRLSAYFLPFRKADGTYFPNVSFQRVQSIYEFDGRIRGVLFKCIEEIELYLRSQLSYYSAHHHGTLGYLEEGTFSEKHDQERFLNLVNGCIEENKRTLVVQHHKEKYSGKFPVWVIIEFFSMGMLSYFYADMKTNEQKELAKDLYGTTATCMKSWLRCITVLRNRCAHYSRLYYWSFPALPKMPEGIDFKANRRLFTQIMVLKFLYPDKDKWNANPLAELEAVIEEYGKDISLKHIGFPDNWVDLLRYESFCVEK